MAYAFVSSLSNDTCAPDLPPYTRRKSSVSSISTRRMSRKSIDVQKFSSINEVNNRKKSMTSFDDQDEQNVLSQEYIELLSDLVGGGTETRNWRGLIFAVLTISFVCSLVALAVVLLTPPKDRFGSEPITFKTLKDSTYQARNVHFQWLKDGGFVYMNTSKDIVKKNDIYSPPLVILASSFVDLYQLKDYSISPDVSMILIRQNIKAIHKYSRSFECKILDIETRKIQTLFDDSERIRLCEWLPDSNDIVANVLGKGLYYFEYKKNTFEPFLIKEEYPFVLSGVPDFLYESEILKSDIALWFTKSSWLIYANFDDKNVNKTDIISYEEDGIKKMKLPFVKVGEVIPNVSLSVFDIKGRKSVDVIIDSGIHAHYLLSVSTSSSSTFTSTWTDRAQRNVYVLLFSAESGRQLQVIHHDITKSAWLEEPFSPYIHDSHIFYARLRQESNDKHYHVYRDAFATSQIQSSYITEGEFEINKIIGIASNSSELFLLSNKKSILTRHIYKVDLSKNDTVLQSLSDNTFGDDCEFIDADLNPHGSQLMVKCLGPGFPKTLVASVGNLSQYVIIEDNHDSVSKMINLKMSKKQFHNISNENGNLEFSLITPHIVDISHQYPLLVWISDSDDLQVAKKWSFGYVDMLASSLHIMVAYVNIRGSKGKGNKFRIDRFGNPGVKEAHDIMSAIKYLVNEQKIIDINNIGIYGEGFGGYIATRILQDSTNQIACAILINPIINLKFHNSYFVEKLYGYSVDNMEEMMWLLDSAADISVGNLKDKNFLIVNGLPEEEVLFENSATLLKILTDADILYTSQIYTSYSQRIFEGQVKDHLHLIITEFLKNCFPTRSIE